jgi:hypothetical protein
MKRVNVFMPYVIQFSSDLLNVHYRRCRETLVSCGEVGNSKICTLARSVRELLPATLARSVRKLLPATSTITVQCVRNLV